VVVEPGKVLLSFKRALIEKYTCPELNHNRTSMISKSRERTA